MKKIAIGLLAAVLFLVGTQSHAQVLVGAGYLFASEKTSGYNETTPYHGFYIGASYNIHLVKGLGVAPGLYANFLAHSESASGGGAKAGIFLMGTAREFALNLPVKLNYAFELGKDRRIFAFAGPVFQLGLSNKTTVNGSVNVGPIHYGGGEKVNNYDPQNGTANRFNIYLGGGIGVQLGDIIFLVGYDHNLLDIDRVDNYRTNRNQIKVGISLDF